MNGNLDFFEERFISVYDMGFLYGFSLFETFLVNGDGSVFLLEEHIDRLYDSCTFFNFKIGVNKSELVKSICEHINSNNISKEVLRLTVTFGNKDKNIEPSFVFTRRKGYTDDIYTKGLKLHVSKCIRNGNSLIIRHKTGNYLENFLVGRQASAEGYDDAVILNVSNEITETTKSNIFFYANGKIYTPAIDCGLLPGITRNWVIEELTAGGVSVVEGRYSMDELMKSEEVFVSNSVMGIAPVCLVNWNDGNKAFKNGCISGMLIKKYKNNHKLAPD